MDERNRNAHLTFDRIGISIAELLELPYERRNGKAFQLGKLVIQIVKDALMRRERVRIHGLGTFKMRTKPGRIAKTCTKISVTGKWMKRPRRGTAFIRERTYAYFRPANDITRSLIDPPEDQKR